MTEAERREIHELMVRASDGDNVAAVAIEVKVLAFEKARATDDTVHVLERLSLLGLGDLRQRIVAALVANSQLSPDDRPRWIA